MPSYAGVSANVASLILPPSVAGGSFAELFTLLGNPPGVAYDFTAPGGLTQDRGGLDVVTAAAQSVGLAHDYARASSGWVSGTELVTNGSFSNGATGWVAEAGWSASGGSAVATAAAAFNAVSQASFPFLAGRSYRVEFQVTASSGGVRINFAGGTQVSGATYTTAGTWGETMTAAAGNNQLRIQAGASGFTGSVDNISVREITGNPLLAPTDARRPTWGAMSNGLPCSVWDGTRAMATAAAVDFSAHDQITVMAAVRSVGNGAVIAEASASADANNGSFLVYRTGGGSFYGQSRGTTAAQALAGSTFTAPDNAILILRSKIGTPSVTLDRNGSQIAINTATQGTGNYGNHIINIGARNAASPSLFFNGEITRIAAIGGALTTEQLTYAVSLISRGFAPSP